MGDYIHTGLTLSVKHVPDVSIEQTGDKTFEKVPLPGIVEIGVEVDGAWIPLFRDKAPRLLKKIARAKAAAAAAAAAAPVYAPPPAQ